MINNHQAIVNKAVEQLEKIKTELEKVKDELQDEYDELSFDAQYSDYGDELQSIIESLENAISDGLETADFELQNATASFDLLPTCDRGEEEFPEEDYDEEEEEEEDEEEDWDVVASAAAGGLFFGMKSGNNGAAKKDAYDPYDTHWESSFDWKDEDNDGYDDRDDGFWNPAE